MTPIPRLARRASCIFLVTLACHPYGDQFQGEFNAGSADPFNFPPAYRATTSATATPGVSGFTREVAGSGRFTETAAWAHGVPANYFRFPFPPNLVTTTGYAAPQATAKPLRAGAGGLTVPLAYQFDPAADPNAPEQDSTLCQAPANYVFDPVHEDVPKDRQGNLLSALPAANYPVGGLVSWSYAPVVRRVTVKSGGEACQAPKSDLTLLTRGDVNVTLDPVPNADGTPRAVPDDVYLAWALIDPGSPVLRAGQTLDTTKGPCVAGAAGGCNGLGTQRFGWYRQFLVAYLDGGAIPFKDTTAGTTTTRDFVPQKLYFPRSGAGAAASANALGGGNDVVEFARGEAGYSPICQVFSYVVPAGQPVPRDAAVIAGPGPYAASIQQVTGAAAVSATGQITPSLIFCLQAQ